MTTERKYICAFTAMGSNYPEYMNVSRHGDEIEIIMREKSSDGKEGKTSSVRFPAVLFGIMLEDANKNMKD